MNISIENASDGVYQLHGLSKANNLFLEADTGCKSNVERHMNYPLGFSKHTYC